MIDRPARNNLAERLRHLASGVISNYDFEDRSRSSLDPVIAEIEFRLAWPACDDGHEHKLAGPRAISLGHRVDFARAILFLKSDLPYEWKCQTGLSGFLNSVFRLWPWTRKPLLDPAAGDLRVWPFFQKEDYRAALEEPPYLDGRARA